MKSSKASERFFLLLILIIIPVASSGQGQSFSYTRDIKLHDNYNEVMPEIAKSFMVSGTSYFIAYETCFKNTDLTQTECRLVGAGASLLAGLALSAIEHNQNTLGYNMYGSLAACFTFTVTIGRDKKRDIKRKLIDL